MIIYGCIIVIFTLFILQKWRIKDTTITSRTKKILQRCFKWFFTIAPMIAVAVFAILLSTVLTGRFYERSSHALILVVLWLFATSFYVDVVIFWQNKMNRIFLLIGFLPTIGLAILLTPLDRYIVLLNNLVPIAVFIVGIMMLAVLYCSIWAFPNRRK